MLPRARQKQVIQGSDDLQKAFIIVLLASAQWLYEPSSEEIISESLKHQKDDAKHIKLIVVRVGMVLISVSSLAGQTWRDLEFSLGTPKWDPIVAEIEAAVAEKYRDDIAQTKWKSGADGPAFAGVRTLLLHANKDQEHADRFERHLKAIQRRGIRWWNAIPGDEWMKLRQDRLQEAEVVVLLISIDLVNDDEMLEMVRREVQRRAPRDDEDLGQQDALLVLGVRVGPCLEDLLPSFTPLNKEPIVLSKPKHRDSAWKGVVEELSKAIADAALSSGGSF